ncbi:MAG: hypothetical protein ABIB71_02385 [Candidatus Woesearchaeota archaeon]
MASVALDRTVDDIFSGYSKLEAPEEKIEHKVEGSLVFDGFEELLGQYERLLEVASWRSDLKKIFYEVKSVLTPRQINSFLQASIKYEDNPEHSDRTGYFITQLIQNSHDAGNNSFILNTKALSKEINNIGRELQGIEDHLLEIIVEGSVGYQCGLKANNLRKLHISENSGNSCGYGASNIQEIYIGGNAKDACGFWAENIGKVYIGGNAGYWCCRSAKNIEKIYIGGDVGKECGSLAFDSTFKTPNKETLRLLKNNVPKDKNNKIYFIHLDKHEEEIEW